MAESKPSRVSFDPGHCTYYKEDIIKKIKFRHVYIFLYLT